MLCTTGEHEYTRYGFRRLIADRAVDILQPSPNPNPNTNPNPNPNPNPHPNPNPNPNQVKANVEAQLEKKMYLNYLQGVSEIILTDDEVETLDDSPLP